MAFMLCSHCDNLFDADEQVEAIFYPMLICEDCVEKVKEQLKETP